MTVVVWEDPPPPPECRPHGATRADWGLVAAELRSRPGEWARVGVRPSPGAAANTAQAIRAGECAGMPYGEFEAQARTCGGEHRVYARYVGAGVGS